MTSEDVTREVEALLQKANGRYSMVPPRDASEFEESAKSLALSLFPDCENPLWKMGYNLMHPVASYTCWCRVVTRDFGGVTMIGHEPLPADRSE